MTFKSFLAAVGLLVAGGTAQATTLSSTFDSSDEGWTGTGGTPVFTPSGGNPGGYIRESDIDGGDQVMIAPGAFHGDLSAFLGGTLSFDGKNINGDSPSWPGFGVVTISNGGLSVTLDLADDGQPPNDEAWHTYSAVLDAADWGPDLAAVLANVTDITVNLEFHDGITETAGFDNFVLTSLPETGVPEPALIGVFGLGLAGLIRARRR